MRHKEILERPAGLDSDQQDDCPKCGRKNIIQYNQYHHWENCPVCGYKRNGVYK
jgi:ribosomal protein L37AE/L43A